MSYGRRFRSHDRRPHTISGPFDGAAHEALDVETTFTDCELVLRWGAIAHVCDFTSLVGRRWIDVTSGFCRTARVFRSGDFELSKFVSP